MKPEKYYPAIYLEDFSRYKEISSTELFDLCPLILGEQLKKKKHTNYASIIDFFTLQYCFNLTSQGIHSYFIESYWDWRENTESYLDIQGCYAHSFGGGTSRPIDLIIFLRKYGINIDRSQLCYYVIYFFNVILIDALPNFPAVDLAAKLLHDPDCTEIHSCMQVILDQEKPRYN